MKDFEDTLALGLPGVIDMLRDGWLVKHPEDADKDLATPALRGLMRAVAYFGVVMKADPEEVGRVIVDKMRQLEEEYRIFEAEFTDD
jgi:hypothetical protein